MPLRKFRVFTGLCAVIVIVAMGTLSAQNDILITISQPHYPVPAPDESLWHKSQPVKNLICSNGVCEANGKILRNVSLPVQSKNPQDLGIGKVLVASRNIGDPNFAETVVLLVAYDTQDVVGLVLNRRTHVPLSKLFQGLTAAKGRSDPAYLGGPVDTAAVFALLQSSPAIKGAKNIFGGVYLISEKTLFEQAISTETNPSSFHVYLGYAGWNTVQLQKEVEVGAWFIFPADASTVFNSDPDSLWSEMIRKTELKLARSVCR